MLILFEYILFMGLLLRLFWGLALLFPEGVFIEFPPLTKYPPEFTPLLPDKKSNVGTYVTLLLKIAEFTNPCYIWLIFVFKSIG
jgi:hypothetical protein